MPVMTCYPPQVHLQIWPRNLLAPARRLLAAPVTRLAAPRRVLGFTCPEPQSPRDLNRDRDVSGAARALRPSLEKPRICKSRGRKDGSGADASGIDAAKVFPCDIM